MMHDHSESNEFAMRSLESVFTTTGRALTNKTPLDKYIEEFLSITANFFRYSALVDVIILQTAGDRGQDTVAVEAATDVDHRKASLAGHREVRPQDLIERGLLRNGGPVSEELHRDSIDGHLMRLKKVTTIDVSRLTLGLALGGFVDLRELLPGPVGLLLPGPDVLPLDRGAPVIVVLVVLQLLLVAVLHQVLALVLTPLWTRTSPRPRRPSRTLSCSHPCPPRSRSQPGVSRPYKF
jgi:hypothetical protein